MTLACRYESKNQPTLPPKSKRKILLITVLGETTVTNSLCPTPTVQEKPPGQEATISIVNTNPDHHKRIDSNSSANDNKNYVKTDASIKANETNNVQTPKLKQTEYNEFLKLPVTIVPSFEEEDEAGGDAPIKENETDMDALYTGRFTDSILAEKLKAHVEWWPFPRRNTSYKLIRRIRSLHNRKKHGTLPNGKLPKTTDQLKTKTSPSRIQSTSNKPSGSNPSVNDKKKHGTLAYSKVENLAEKQKPLSPQTKPPRIQPTLNKPSGINPSVNDNKKRGTFPNGKLPKTTDNKVKTSILERGSSPPHIQPKSNKPTGSNPSVSDKKKHGTLPNGKLTKTTYKVETSILKTKPSPSNIQTTLNKPSGSNRSLHNRKKEGTLPNGKLPKTTDQLKTGPSPPFNIHTLNKPSGSNSSSYSINSYAETDSRAEEDPKDMEDESSMSTHIEVDSVSLSPSPNFDIGKDIEPAQPPVKKDTAEQVANQIALSMFILYGSRAPPSMLDKLVDYMKPLVKKDDLHKDEVVSIRKEQDDLLGEDLAKEFPVLKGAKNNINKGPKGTFKDLDRIRFEKLSKKLFPQELIKYAGKLATHAEEQIKELDTDTVRKELNKAYPNLIPTLFPPRKGGKTRKLVTILKILIALSGKGESTF